VDWIYLGRDVNHWRALVNISWNINVPQNAGNIVSSYAIVSFSKWTRRISRGIRVVMVYEVVVLWIFVVYEIRTKQ
jgi:hypothetical protein